MSKQHTPGPWIYSANKDNTSSRVSFSVGTACEEEHEFMNGSDISRHTALCTNSDVLMSVDEAEANARLVAAAPQLLEAAKKGYEFMANQSYNINCVNEISSCESIRSLINYVEGKD